jgi:hypothetical protein
MLCLCLPFAAVPLIQTLCCISTDFFRNTSSLLNHITMGYKFFHLENLMFITQLIRLISLTQAASVV